MIKSLLDADENPPPGTKVIIEETVISPPVESVSNAAPIERLAETENILEIPDFGGEPENASELFDAANDTPKNQRFVETFSEHSQSQFETIPESAQTLQDEKLLFQSVDSVPPSGFVPESQAETIRKSGLAYAAAITLFGSIVFLLVIGWFADTLLGTDPWGKIGGIVLGAVIGFLQFFRLTSQILKNKN